MCLARPPTLRATSRLPSSSDAKRWQLSHLFSHPIAQTGNPLPPEVWACSRRAAWETAKTAGEECTSSIPHALDTGSGAASFCHMCLSNILSRVFHAVKFLCIPACAANHGISTQGRDLSRCTQGETPRHHAPRNGKGAGGKGWPVPATGCRVAPKPATFRVRCTSPMHAAQSQLATRAGAFSKNATTGRSAASSTSRLQSRAQPPGRTRFSK
jgi:hypothetical protein